MIGFSGVKAQLIRGNLIKLNFFLLEITFVSANSADPDEMLSYAAFHHKTAFHLGLHCLPKNLFTGNPNEKGLHTDQPELECCRLL